VPNTSESQLRGRLNQFEQVAFRSTDIDDPVAGRQGLRRPLPQPAYRFNARKSLIQVIYRHRDMPGAHVAHTLGQCRAAVRRAEF